MGDRMDRGRRAGRWLGRLLLFNLLLLPRAVRRSIGHDPVGGLLLLPLGVLAMLTVLLSTLDEVRVLFLFWWTDDVTPGTWGGPTMAGAWAVHALLGLVLLPVFLGVMAGIRFLVTNFDDGSGRSSSPSSGSVARTGHWSVVLADVAALAFLVAFVAQL